MITQLDSENADRNLTSQVTVLTHTPNASLAMLCQALVQVGDGTKNLDGTGGDFELEITVGGNTVQPGPQVITLGASDTRAAFVSAQFPVPANTEVVVKLLSPNGADTDVDVTAYLYDVQAANTGTIQTLDALDTAQDAQHSTTQGKVDTAQADLDLLTGSDGVTLATAQGNYAPAKAGDEMDLVDAPNATAVTAIQSGLSTYNGSDTSGTTTLLSRLSATRAGYLDNLSAGAVATAAKLLAYFQLLFRKDAAIETDNATELTAINADGGSGAGSYSAQTDSTQALRDRGDTAWTTATGFSTLDAAGVRSAIGLSTANLDTQLGDIPTNSELTTALSSLSTLDAAGVRAAIGMAGADMDTQLDAILAVATIIRKLKTGNIIDKPGGGAGEYQVLDDDDTTAYANVTLSESSPQQQVTLL